jgi:hypothetical protein
MEKGRMKDPATGNSYSVKMQFNSEEQWTKVRKHCIPCCISSAGAGE